jgi:hypothetical protein
MAQTAEQGAARDVVAGAAQNPVKTYRKTSQRSAMTVLMIVGFAVVFVAILLLIASFFRPVQLSQPAETLMLIGRAFGQIFDSQLDSRGAKL